MRRVARSIIGRALDIEAWPCAHLPRKRYSHSSPEEGKKLSGRSSGWHLLPPFSGFPTYSHHSWSSGYGNESLTNGGSREVGDAPRSSINGHRDSAEWELENIAGGQSSTAARWVQKCCRGLPHSLVMKLFRKRQVRMVVLRTQSALEGEVKQSQALSRDFKLQKVKADEELPEGAVLCLPGHILNHGGERGETEEERARMHERKKLDLNSEAVQKASAQLHNCILYKDNAAIVINKPPGLAVQGGSKVKLSLDNLLPTLSFGKPDSPRLVHRLDMETSGALVLGRTQESTRILHALFRQKSASASEKRTIEEEGVQRRYWALVTGVPSLNHGRISEPLAKVVLSGGRGDRIVLARTHFDGEAQHALTEYRVLSTTRVGSVPYTWLELRPVTGRKHQLRVHCAEVLGMPIVGDFKYGWKSPATNSCTPSNSHTTSSTEAEQTQDDPLLPSAEPQSGSDNHVEEREASSRSLSFDTERQASCVGEQEYADVATRLTASGKHFDCGDVSERGAVHDAKPGLHLHCHHLSFPRLQFQESSEDRKMTSERPRVRVRVFAPLPAHMASSWKTLGFPQTTPQGDIIQTGDHTNIHKGSADETF